MYFREFKNLFGGILVYKMLKSKQKILLLIMCVYIYIYIYILEYSAEVTYQIIHKR